MNSTLSHSLSVLDAKLLAKVVAEAVLKVCGEWQTSLPTLTCPKLRRELSIYAAKNTRRKMEDRHSICVDINSLYNIKVCLDRLNNKTRELVIYYITLFPQ